MADGVEGDFSLSRLCRLHNLIIVRVYPISFCCFGGHLLSDFRLLRTLSIHSASGLYFKLMDNLDILFDLLL